MVGKLAKQTTTINTYSSLDYYLHLYLFSREIWGAFILNGTYPIGPLKEISRSTKEGNWVTEGILIPGITSTGH